MGPRRIASFGLAALVVTRLSRSRFGRLPVTGREGLLRRWHRAVNLRGAS